MKLVRTDAIDNLDVDGKPFVRERVELARKQSEFWQEYKFSKSRNQKVEPKLMYCERSK